MFIKHGIDIENAINNTKKEKNYIYHDYNCGKYDF